jgi:GH35 family endo-1,4-beta-xylanase
VDFKFEESMRIEEIQRFARDVVPEPRFLFNEYKVTNNMDKQSVMRDEKEQTSFDD